MSLRRVYLTNDEHVFRPTVVCWYLWDWK